MGSIMAKLVIINKDKLIINAKAFNCKISNLCSIISDFNDTLYHNGSNALPVDGDTIYRINNNMQYELFTNNSAAIKHSLAATINLNFIKTDIKGICTIITCN